MTPIEKVARAVYEATPRNKPYSLLTLDQRSQFDAMARAAIEALREPSEAMCDAGSSQSQRGGFEPKDTWRLMVDAALAEGTK